MSGLGTRLALADLFISNLFSNLPLMESTCGSEAGSVLESFLKRSRTK